MEGQAVIPMESASGQGFSKEEIRSNEAGESHTPKVAPEKLFM